MKLIYVAGAFRASTSWKIEVNTRKAEEYALKIWKLGVTAVCPHTNSRFFQDEVPDDLFLHGYLELMSRCDAVFVVPGYENSEGTKAEIELADKLSIPTFYSLEELSEHLY